MMEKRFPDETLDNAIEVRKTSMEAYMNDKEYFPGLDEVTIQFLEELKQYRAIGTVEECRAAVERMQPKEPLNVDTEGIRYTDSYRCPNCEGNFTGTGIAKHCYHCGQAIDWGKE